MDGALAGHPTKFPRGAGQLCYYGQAASRELGTRGECVWGSRGHSAPSRRGVFPSGPAFQFWSISSGVRARA